ncbi:MAG: hypothetical protein Q4E59_01290 [Bacteroidales bacterium]|nr:hypothetical protein [Bacteroidales bacterium]
MHQLNKLQTIIYNAGGIILLIGAMLPMFLSDATVAPYVYSVGALMFCAMQFLQRYEGQNITIRRLRRQQILGAIALLATGGLMFCSLYGVSPFDGPEWQMVLAIGAVLEVYTAFRIPAELNKEQH